MAGRKFEWQARTQPTALSIISAIDSCGQPWYRRESLSTQTPWPAGGSKVAAAPSLAFQYATRLSSVVFTKSKSENRVWHT